jgi:hypothetical protein
MIETVSGKDVNGNTEFTTTTHAPDGSITVAKAANPPAATSDILTFKRFWVIEQSPSGLPAGLRRFTVLVSLQTVGPVPTTFQASMLR